MQRDGATPEQVELGGLGFRRQHQKHGQICRRADHGRTQSMKPRHRDRVPEPLQGLRSLPPWLRNHSLKSDRQLGGSLTCTS